jgi:hypothetical protein
MSGLLLAAALLAQPQQPDWIVARAYNAHGILRGHLATYRPSTGAWTTLVASTREGIWYEAVTHYTDNSIVLTSRVEAGVCTLVGVAPSGGNAPVAAIRGQSLRSIVQDEDGAWACPVRNAFLSPLLLRADAGGTVTTLIPAVGALFSECAGLDPESGDYLVAGWDGTLNVTHLLRHGRRTGATTTLASLPGRVVGLDHDPARNRHLVVRNNLDLLAVGPTGQVTILNAAIPYLTTVRVDVVTGNIAVGTLTGSVHFLDSAGVRLGGTADDVLQVMGIEQLGSRRVSAVGVGVPGSTVNVSFSFPRAPGRPYVAALSTGLRPGIALGDGRVLSLDATSPLFAASLGGLAGVTTGFAGTLDGLGRAAGTVLVLPGLPAGTRLFVSAVALDPALPLGVELGNTSGFTTN